MPSWDEAVIEIGPNCHQQVLFFAEKVAKLIGVVYDDNGDGDGDGDGDVFTTTAHIQRREPTTYSRWRLQGVTSRFMFSAPKPAEIVSRVKRMMTEQLRFNLKAVCPSLLFKSGQWLISHRDTI